MFTFLEFQQIIERARAEGATRLVVPVHRRLGADLLTPVSAFFQLRHGARSPFLLESVEGGEKLARYSFLGRNPYLTVTARGGATTISYANPDKPDELGTGDVFDVLKELMLRYTEVASPQLPRLTGGAVGYFSYDCVRLIERLPEGSPPDLDVPDAIWCFYDTVAAFDHVKHQLVLMASAFVNPGEDLKTLYDTAVKKLDDLEATFSQPVVPGSEKVVLKSGVRSNVDQSTFEAAVERAKGFIYEGDIFQVVLSQRFESSFSGDPFNLYRALRQINPSPYLFYLDFDSFKLVGSSPEVLVRVENRRAELLPIAGTRPRADAIEEDKRLEAELLADTKERAEHLMLVDLGRNDLGRISKYGSVKVEKYAFVERYSHVMHIVSSVSGELTDEGNAIDVFKACFPAGTVSGAPKVRAMEIIDELEPTRRGVYAGAVGYLDFRGNLDTCITIRTMLVKDNTVYIQAGAGIVADSDPTLEFEETRNKAKALHSAMNAAAEELL
ncbi:anthranilate synthase component I [bacterium]|nr:anthranilate synthase component I [bacterium]